MGDVDPSLDVAAVVEQLHDVGKHFGQLRDAEIISARVTKILADQTGTLEGQRLLETVADEKYRAQIASDVALDSGAIRNIVDALNELRITLPSDAITTAMARPVAQQAIRVTWRAVKRSARTAEADGGDDALHALRRAIKRAVYSTKGYSYVLGPSAEEFVARLVTLQKVIGRQHDHVIVAEWLHQAGEDHASLKLLAEPASLEERRKADNGSSQWTRAWDDVRALHPKKTVMTSYSFFD
jgi:CHAD domain-containing protein